MPLAYLKKNNDGLVFAILSGMLSCELVFAHKRNIYSYLLPLEVGKQKLVKIQ